MSTIMRIECLLCCFSVFKSVLTVSSSDSQGPVFVTEPRSSIEFSNDIGAIIPCSAYGSPEPTISWLMSDGTSVTSILHMREVTANGTLYFSPFGAESYRHDVHATVYRCEASNTVGRILSREINVRAVVKQHYDVMVRDAYVLAGNTAVLKCEIPTFVRDHVSITSWIQDSSFNIYPSPYSEGKHHMLPTGELLVYSVTAGDSHPTYRCRTVHHITGKTVESSISGKVIVTDNRGQVPPRYHERVPLTPVREGEVAVLSCISQGFPPPSYWWFRELPPMGTQMEPISPSEKLNFRGGVLVMQNAQISDSGRYICIANNTVGSERVELQLTVLSPISVHLTPQHVTVDIGHDTELSCSTTGHPTPVVTWRKDSLPLRETSHRIRIFGEKKTQLRITGVVREDRGMYQCFAKNDYEMAQGTAELSLGDAAPQLMYKFIEQTMQPGPSVSLKCIAAGNPTPHFIWALDGFPLSHNDRLVIGQYVTVHGDVISHVNISSVRVEDGGQYRCIAKNRVGSTAHSARLNIYGLPLVRPMNTIAAVAGHDLVLQCPVAGYPISTILWEKDGQMLPMNRRQEVSQNGTLVIRKVDSSSDRGTYSCTAKNKQGHHDSKTVQIDVKVPPKIEHFSFPSDIQQGSRVLVTCVVSSGDLPLRIEWLFDGSPVLPEGVTTYTHGEDDLSLRIASAAPRHNGNYSCVARNQAAQVSHEAALIVHVPPRIAPFFFNKDLSEGVRAHVSCVIEKGDPPFTITWLKDREPLSAEGLKIIGLDTHSSTVVVDQLAASHSGNYTCRAANEVAAVEHTAQLVVSVPPRWSVPPENQQAPQGVHGYSLDCQAEGNPTPTITWRRGMGKTPGSYRDLAQQEHGSDIKVFSNGSLLIEKLREEHEGYYLCEAFNGIGTGLSKRIYLTVNAPPQFTTKYRNHTARLGSSSVLSCEVRGDRPINVVWRKAGSTLDATVSDYRYNVKETNSTESVLSELSITNTVKEDSGRFFCMATNTFGRDETTVHLFIQQPPDYPRNIHVIEKGSRFVKLGWMLSQDGNSPILQSIIEYKMESEMWHEKAMQTAVPSNQAAVMVGSLRPATTYQFRLFAENELGKSLPSEILNVMTDGEVPSGVPRNVRVEAVSSTVLRVLWDAPERDTWNGEILGYHIGFKEQRMKDDQYQYKNCESSGSGSGGETLLPDLKKFTKYSIIVQAYNALGPGPTSTEMLALTLEDTPSAAPQDVRCSAFTSQSIQVSWSPVPDTQLHGHLKGYKVIWENLEDFELSSKPETKITTALSVVIHGLLKFTNYSIQVLAFTNAGDGVASSPLHCLTMEDVPEVPSAIKAVVSSTSSIVVSWLPPTHSNGILTSYNLQIRSVGPMGVMDQKPKRYSVPPHLTSYEEEGLSKRGQYEFTIAAVTKIGEGVRTLPISISPSSEVRAAIYSFGGKTVLPWKSDARLPCRSVGKPEPTLVWKHWSKPLKSSARFKIRNDGTLQIENLIRDDSGNYSCYVENLYGSDTIIHHLMVQVPPSPPLLHASRATSNSLHLQWKQGDDGGAPIRGYYLHYKKVNADWESTQLGRQLSSYLLNELYCGTPYQIYIEAYNSIGKGEKSQVVSATTEGSKPSSIPKESFLIPNTTYASLYLDNWLDNGCPIMYFELEYKRQDESKWTLVSNSLEKQSNFLLKNLQPGTEYILRIKAINNAGAAQAEYRFVTLHKIGDPVSPSLTRHSGQEEIPFYLDLRLILPTFVSCLAILSAVLAVYYCLSKRSIFGDTSSRRESHSSAIVDNKQNMQQREQYYATVRKPLRSPVRELQTLERIPEHSEDIYPYATFELNQASTGGETRCTSGAPLDRDGSDLEQLERDRGRITPLQTFLYHDPILASAETLKIRESDCGKPNIKNIRRGFRRKSRSKSERGDCNVDNQGSETDTDISGGEMGASSRTESVNQLDGPISQNPGVVKDRSSSQLSRHRSRLHNIIYQGPETTISSESSPVYERKSFPRRGRSKILQLARYSFETPRTRAPTPKSASASSFESPSPFLFNLEPPSGFSDSLELSEAECDRSMKLNAYRCARQPHPPRDFTIAV